MTALRLSWRNLCRNGRRTAITVGAIVLSTFVLVVGRALMVGLVDSAVANATNLSVGEAQVHAAGYLADRSFYTALDQARAVLAAADAGGIPAAPRSYGHGLVAAGSRSSGALFWGVDPPRERVAFELAQHVGAGRFLPAAPGGGVVLGRKLARSLGVGVGDELIVVVQAADGSLGNELYRVRGILKAIGEGIDRTTAILHRADFDALFVGGGRIHEVALNGRGGRALSELVALAAEAAPGADVRTWRELLPMLSDMLATMNGALWIFGSIFFLAAGLGVLNTMLMATHERVHEFGLLKALGTSPWRIVRDVTVESLLLGLLGTSVGATLGVLAAMWLERTGIDTRTFAGETSFAGVAFDPIWRATFEPGLVVGPIALLWLACVVAALYPAGLAARLDPVEAMRRV